MVASLDIKGTFFENVFTKCPYQKPHRSLSLHKSSIFRFHMHNVPASYVCNTSKRAILYDLYDQEIPYEQVCFYYNFCCSTSSFQHEPQVTYIHTNYMILIHLKIWINP